MAKYVSFGVLLAVIAVLAIMFYKILAGFLVPLFLAALLVVIFRPLHDWMIEKCRGQQTVAAVLTTLSILLAVLAPIGILSTLAVLEGKEAYAKFNSGTVVSKILNLRETIGLETPQATQIRGIDENFKKLRENWTAADIEFHQGFWYEIATFEKQLENQFNGRVNEIDELLKTDAPDSNSLQTEMKTIASKLELLAQFDEAVQEASEMRNQMALQNELSISERSEDMVKLLGQYHEEINDSVTRFDEFKNRLLGGRIMANLKLFANPDSEQVTEYSEAIVDFFKGKLIFLGGATTAFVIQLVIGGAIMIISLYFFLLDGPAMIAAIQGLSPLDDAHERELVVEFGKVSRAVVVATLLSALVQGILAGIGYYFCGFESIILMMLLTTALALVPFFGAASVWLPAALYLFFIQQNIPAAIGLAIYGAAVVSMADNFIKPLILHGQSKLHPLLALLSILGGVSALGPIGLLVGPMVVAFLQTLLKILQRELSAMENAEAGSA